MRGSGGDHMHKLGLVRRAHDDHVRQAGQIGDVIDTCMGGAVIADNTGPVDGKAHRKVLNGDVMHQLVIATLQEGRIQRTEGLHALGRQTSREGHRMLFGDADIKHPVRETRLHLVDASAGRHRRSDGNDPVVGLGLGDQAVGEDRSIARGVAGRLVLRSGNHIEFRNSVVFLCRRSGKGMALALFGDDMDEHRTARMAVTDVLQHRQQMRHVMAVDRTDMEESQLAEDRIAADQVAGSLAGAPRRALDLGREPAGHLAHQVTDRMERLGGDQTRQVAAHRADRLADRHVIVVQDDDQARVRRPGIVHALERHAGAHRAVADHGNDVALDSLQVAADRHAEAGGNRGRGMACTERVELRLAALGET